MNSTTRIIGVTKVILAVVTLLILVVGWEFLGSYIVHFGIVGLSARVVLIVGFISLIVSAAYDLRWKSQPDGR